MPTFTTSPQWRTSGLQRASEWNSSRAACRARTRTNARSASSLRASIDSVATRRATRGRRRARVRRLRPRSAMIRLPMLNVDSWFAGVRDDDERAALSAAPNASSLASSAEDVFRAKIAAAVNRQCSRCDRINLCDSESCRNEALERHSEALHIGRCGGRAVQHERDVSNIRLVASAVNGDQTSTIAQMPDQAERRRGHRPQAVRNARSKRSGER